MWLVINNTLICYLISGFEKQDRNKDFVTVASKSNSVRPACGPRHNAINKALFCTKVKSCMLQLKYEITNHKNYQNVSSIFY